MKRVISFLFVIVMGISAMAQSISVKSFQALPMDMTASSLEGKRIDQNGAAAALIKIVTSQTGFAFDGGALGIVDSKQMVGEVWVWVPYGSRKITISHQQLGVLRDYRYPIEIQSERTYEMVLTTAKIETIVKEEVREQYLMFQITPPEAVLEVNDQMWSVSAEGTSRKLVDFGTYNYRVQAPNYHPEAGNVTVDDPDNTKIVTITLKPNFGWVEVPGTGTLQEAAVYIDNALIGKAPCKSEALKSGVHNIKIQKDLYVSYNATVTVNDNETTTVSPDLTADFARVTLQVDADAEIWVNDERKGIRTWTGNLESGTYKMECRLVNHESTTTKKEITNQMNGEVIHLEAPRPIYGSLNVESTPDMAVLYIDGKEMGETPKRINSILIGEHTVRIEKQGCAPVNRTVTIEEGKTYTMDEKLDTGRSIVVKTDRSGDKIYVDGGYVGETPRETALGFGQHTVRVVRNGIGVEKQVDVTQSSRNGLELAFEFGRLITIHTDKNGDEVLVDGEKVGTSPVSIDLPYGKHSIHAERDKKYADKDIEVMKEGGLTEHSLILHGETVSHFVQNGVNFVTLDGAYSTAPQFSYGATFGMVKRVGWFVTAASNFSFDAMKYTATCDSQGYVDNDYPEYTGESCSTRLSAMAGLVVRVEGPVCLKVGAGYGSRVKSWYTADGNLVKYENNSFTGIDATAGVQLHLKGFTVGVDAVTTNFKTLEFKIGMGYCWKKK